MEGAMTGFNANGYSGFAVIVTFPLVAVQSRATKYSINSIGIGAGAECDNSAECGICFGLGTVIAEISLVI